MNDVWFYIYFVALVAAFAYLFHQYDDFDGAA